MISDISYASQIDLIFLVYRIKHEDFIFITTVYKQNINRINGNPIRNLRIFFASHRSQKNWTNNIIWATKKMSENVEVRAGSRREEKRKSRQTKFARNEFLSFPSFTFFHLRLRYSTVVWRISCCLNKIIIKFPFISLPPLYSAQLSFNENHRGWTCWNG